MKAHSPEQIQGTIHSHIPHQRLLPKNKPLKLVKRRTTQPIQTLKTSKRKFENSPQTEKPTNCTPEPLEPMTSIPPQRKTNGSPPQQPKSTTSPPQPPKSTTSPPQPPTPITSPPQPPKPITSPLQPPKPITSPPQPPKPINSPPQPPKPTASPPQPPKPTASPPQPQQSDSDKHRLSCKACDKKYTHRASLYKHIQKNHPDLASNNAGSIQCMETMCSFTCRYLAELRRHLVVSHSIPMETENLTFSTMEGVFITMFMQVLY